MSPTYTGCLTCRIRRKKCDEIRGGPGGALEDCQTCARLGIKCLGYGIRRPSWMKDKGALARYKEEIRAFLERPGRRTRKDKEVPPPNMEESDSTTVRSWSPQSTDSRQTLIPHPHDLSTLHTSVKAYTAYYWHQQYRNFYPGSNSQVYVMIDMLLRRAPGSPLAHIVTRYPAPHCQAMGFNPGKSWKTLPWHQSTFTQFCLQLVESFDPTVADTLTDDHIAAMCHLLGFSVLTITPGPSQRETLSLAACYVLNSSLIPNQPLKHRGAVTRRACKNVAVRCGGLGLLPDLRGADLLQILTEPDTIDEWPTLLDDRLEKKLRMGSMCSQAMSTIHRIDGLARWKKDEERKGRLSVPKLVCRGMEIQNDIGIDVDTVLTKHRRLATDGGYEVCADIHRSSAVLYLHCVLSKPCTSVPEVKAATDLIVDLLLLMPLAHITARNACSLSFPIALAAAVNSDPVNQIALDVATQSLSSTCLEYWTTLSPEEIRWKGNLGSA